MQLKGAEQAAKEKADAERKRLEAKAKARRERFIRHRDEGIAAFRAKDYETAKIALGNALKEEQDADIQAMLDDAIDRTMRHPIAVADFRVLAPDIDRSAGQALAERLLSRFQARYQVIERAQLATYLNEVDLTMADIVHNPALLKGKKLRGVRYLVMGSINRFGDLAVSARVVDIVRNPGAHKQSHQITGSSLAILNDQLDELAKVLQMTNEEKDDYLPGRGELPVPTIASTDPSDPGWWLDRATQLARAIADQDKQAALLKEIVLARSESGRSDLAVALIQSLRDPRERAVAYTLGMTVAARRRDKLGVRRFLEKARSCVRNQPPPFVLSLLALACIESCFSAGDRDSAQAVLEVYGDVAKQSLGKGTSSNLRAFLAALRGDLKEAESIAEGASDTNTKDLAHAYIVRALSAVRDLPRAKQFLKRIAASTRAHREAYAYLVIAMAQSGDATGASDVLGGEDFPFGTIYAVRAALGIGRVQLKAGDLEGFRATLSWQAAVSAALLTDPHLECEAYSGIAHLYAYAGDAPAARKSLEKAREAYGKLEGKEGTGFLREIGHVQAMLGDIEDALAMAKNIKNEPERLQALLEIGKGLGETATKVDLDSIARRLGNDIERAYFSIGVAVGLANKPGTP